MDLERQQSQLWVTLFISHGFKNQLADDEAKKLLDTKEVVNEIRNTFGEEIIKNNLVENNFNFFY